MKTIPFLYPRNLGILIVLLFAPMGFAQPPVTKAPGMEQHGRDHDVRQVIQDFIHNIKIGAAAKAYQSDTTPSFREQTSLQEFYDFVARYPSFNRNKGSDILSITYNENIANVTVNLGSIEHKDNIVVFAVSYAEGHWRILGITVHPSATP